MKKRLLKSIVSSALALSLLLSTAPALLAAAFNGDAPEARTGTATVAALEYNSDGKPSMMAALLNPAATLTDVSGSVYATIKFQSAELLPGFTFKGTDVYDVRTYDGETAYPAEVISADEESGDYVLRVYIPNLAVDTKLVLRNSFMGERPIALNITNVEWASVGQDEQPEQPEAVLATGAAAVAALNANGSGALSMMSAMLNPNAALENVNGNIYVTIKFQDAVLETGYVSVPVRGTDVSGVITYDGATAHPAEVISVDAENGDYVVRVYIPNLEADTTLTMVYNGRVSTVLLNITNVVWDDDSNSDDPQAPQGPIDVASGAELDAALRSAISGTTTINLTADIDAVTSATYSAYEDGTTVVINGQGHTIDGKGVTGTALWFGIQSVDLNLDIRDTVFTNLVSHNTFGGGAVGVFFGSIKISGSAFINNSAEAATRNGGGAILLQSARDYTVPHLEIVNSTFVGNKAGTRGGGAIYSVMQGSVVNSTIVGNTAKGGSGGITVAADRNSVLQPFTVANSIITGNGIAIPVDVPDVDSGSLVVENDADNIVNAIDLGGNIIGSGAGELSAWLAQELSAAAGETPTLALLTVKDSPAIGAAIAELAPAVDQRGVARGSQPDVGAYELAKFDVATGEELNNAIKSVTSGPVYINLTADIDAVTSATYTGYKDGTTVVINGQGHTIDGHNAANTSLRFGVRNFNINLAVKDTTFANLTNSIRYGGGAIAVFFGNVSISGSAFTGNATGASNTQLGGGAVLVQSTVSGSGGRLEIVNSTFVDNTANIGGGAIHSGIPGSVVNSTIVGNTSKNGSGGISASATQAFTVANNIVVANTGTADVLNAVDLGGNLTGVFANAGELSVTDLDGTSSWLAQELSAAAGKTPTLALLAVKDSPAIDAAIAELAPAVDQRGVTRDSQPDVGAYELVKFDVASGAELNAALRSATSGTTVINLTADIDAVTSATYSAYADGTTVILNGQGHTIDGKGVTGTALWFGIQSVDLNLDIRDTVFTNLVSHAGRGYGGGAVGVFFGSIKVSGSAFINNSAEAATRNGGGAILLQSARDYTVPHLEVVNSTFVGNKAGTGGGGAIYSIMRGSVVNSTIVGNTALNGSGGITVAADRNGVVQPLTIVNSIVSGNGGDADTINAVDLGGNIIGQNAEALSAWLAQELSAADGETPTLALLNVKNSPAVDAALAELAPAVDQRGVARDSQPDIGAYELVKSTIEEPDYGEISVIPVSIVQDHLSYIHVLYGEALGNANADFALLDHDRQIVGASVKGVNGRAVIGITAPNEPGFYDVVAQVGGKTVAQGSIEVLPYNPNIWETRYSVSDAGTIVINFNEGIATKDKKYDGIVSVNGKVVKSYLDGDRSLVTDVAWDDLADGTTLFSSKGIIYPRLYPSYSFTFPTIVEKVKAIND